MTASAAVVRLATASDAAGIARVHVDSWRAAYAGVVPQSVLDGLSLERREAFWLAEASEAGRHLWVATIDADSGAPADSDATRIVGFASTGPARDEDLASEGAQDTEGAAGPRPGELYAIYVAPDAWDRGVGAALFRAAVADLRAQAFEPLVLWVLTANTRGRRFYERMGWLADGAARMLDFAGTPIEEVRYRPGPPG